jgi:GT2 family glycosyltransferase
MGGAFCIKKNVYDCIGGFDLKLPAEEERDLYIRIKEEGYKVKYLHHLMASHFDFKSSGRNILYSLTSYRAASIFLPLINSIKRGTLSSWSFVYKKALPTLIVDLLSIFVFIVMLLGFTKISFGIFIILFMQIISIIYSIKIKRKGYFIIWKSGILSLFKTIKILKRKINYKVEEIK